MTLDETIVALQQLFPESAAADADVATLCEQFRETLKSSNTKMKQRCIRSILGITPDMLMEPVQVKKAYTKQRLACHPDKNLKTDEEPNREQDANEIFICLKAAHTLLPALKQQRVAAAAAPQQRSPKETYREAKQWADRERFGFVPFDLRKQKTEIEPPPDEAPPIIIRIFGEPFAKRTRLMELLTGKPDDKEFWFDFRARGLTIEEGNAKIKLRFHNEHTQTHRMLHSSQLINDAVILFIDTTDAHSLRTIQSFYKNYQNLIGHAGNAIQITVFCALPGAAEININVALQYMVAERTHLKSMRKLITTKTARLHTVRNEISEIIQRNQRHYIMAFFMPEKPDMAVLKNIVNCIDDTIVELQNIELKGNTPEQITDKRTRVLEEHSKKTSNLVREIKKSTLQEAVNLALDKTELPPCAPNPNL